MLSKELEILRHIKELYSEDISEADFEIAMAGKEKITLAWREAFENFDVKDVLNAIDEYFVKKNNRTPPRIPQIIAMLKVQNVKEEIEPEMKTTGEICLPDLDVKYMQEDIDAGSCKHNLYYYSEALRKIRNNEYPILRDVLNPSKSEIMEVVEELCEKKTGKKWEFLSKNELISQGYDTSKKYSMDDVMELMRF